MSTHIVLLLEDKKIKTMKHLTLIILLMITISGYSQVEVKTDTLNQVVNGLKQGYWIHKNDDNITLSEGNYTDDFKIGIWKEYSIDTPTVFQGAYINGLQEGDWYLISTADGTKLDLQKFKEGVKVGGATLSW